MPMNKNTKKLGPDDGFGQSVVREQTRKLKQAKEGRELYQRESKKWYRKARTEGLGN